MIIATGIGAALSFVALLAAARAAQPKPKPVPVRARRLPTRR